MFDDDCRRAGTGGGWAATAVTEHGGGSPDTGGCGDRARQTGHPRTVAGATSSTGHPPVGNFRNTLGPGNDPCPRSPDPDSDLRSPRQGAGRVSDGVHGSGSGGVGTRRQSENPTTPTTPPASTSSRHPSRRPNSTPETVGRYGRSTGVSRRNLRLTRRARGEDHPCRPPPTLPPSHTRLRRPSRPPDAEPVRTPTGEEGRPHRRPCVPNSG